MSLLPSNQGNDRIFNNADSFAMAFDQAWKDCGTTNVSSNEQLNEVLSKLKTHPFLMEHPSEAREIAKFRIRLLKLE